MFSRKLSVLLTNSIECIGTGNKYSTATAILQNISSNTTSSENNADKASSQALKNGSKPATKPNGLANNKPVRLFTSVCIERMPVITSDMNDLEKRYSHLINEINIRKSYLSNHELRHLKDLERAKKKKSSEEESDLVIETALDYEEKCLKELKKLQFSERNLASDFDLKKSKSDANNSQLQNVDYILDKKLILLVNDPATSTWQLPFVEWTNKDASLKNTAERTISNLNENLAVDFMGKAPVGFYKINSDDQKTVNKFYFFKAQYKSGAQFLALSKLDFVWIRKEEIKQFIKNKDYLECLNNFILDF